MKRLANWLVIAALCLGATASAAQEIRLAIAAETNDLRDKLTRASLLLAFEAEGEVAAQDILAAARADYRRLLTGLYSAGYYGGTVSIRVDGREASAIAPLQAPRHIERVEISVTPGPLFAFGDVTLGPTAPATTLPTGFASGAPAQSDIVRAAALAAVGAWRDAGHAKATPAAQQIIARHTTATLDVDVTIDPGPELRFGPLTPTGSVAVSPERITEIAGLPTGEIFSPVALALATQRLRRTGAFRAVTLVEAEEIGADDTLPITAKLVDEAPRRLGYGVEYSSVDGLGVTGYWMHRNILGGAENLRIEGAATGLGGETGGADYTLGARFLRPATFGPDYDLFIQAGAELLDEPDYTLSQIEASVGVSRIIDETLSATAGLQFAVADVSDDLGDRAYTLIALPVTGTLDRRDNPADAHRGLYLAVEATPFLGLGDAESGLRLFGDGRGYFSFGETRPVTLAARAQIGAVIGASAVGSPSDYLFYSGGGDTVRGQPYQSLGVDLGGGNSIGGLSFAGLSIEARVPVTGKIGVVGFVDAGYVGAAATPLTTGDWHAGAGIGLRYDTGIIGPIRLDLATPVTGAGAGSDLAIYIGIGQAF